jgi:hypothetical protein
MMSVTDTSAPIYDFEANLPAKVTSDNECIDENGLNRPIIKFNTGDELLFPP